MNVEPVRWVYVSESGIEIYVDRVSRSDGTHCFAVRRGVEVMSVYGVWIYEPRPSERSDEFLQQHRFESLADAVKVLSQWLRD